MRLALKVTQNDGDFVDVILLYARVAVSVPLLIVPAEFQFLKAID